MEAEVVSKLKDTLDALDADISDMFGDNSFGEKTPQPQAEAKLVPVPEDQLGAGHVNNKPTIPVILGFVIFYFSLLTCMSMFAAKTNCGHAAHANKMLCKAYGENSPLCMGARAQHRVECSSSGPVIPHFNLGEDVHMLDTEDPMAAEVEADAAADDKNSLTRAMTPVIAQCKVLDSKSRTQCTKLLEEAKKGFQTNVMAIKIAKEQKNIEDEWIAKKLAADKAVEREMKAKVAEDAKEAESERSAKVQKTLYSSSSSRGQAPAAGDNADDVRAKSYASSAGDETW